MYAIVDEIHLTDIIWRQHLYHKMTSECTIPATFIEYSHRTRHCSKHFTWITSLNPHNKPMMYVLLLGSL